MSGYISLGKYASARDDALHYLCTSDWSNGEFGSMDFGAYNWRISNDWEEVKPENGEFNSIMDYWFSINPEVDDSSIFRRDLVGHFLVIQAESGAVSVITFETEEELDDTFKKMQAVFDEWDAKENGEDEL